MAREGYVLLVEDSPGDAGLVRQLVDEGADDADRAELRWVQTVRAARETLLREPDCIALLLDLGLPDAQGLEALAALRPLAADFPVVVLTGDGSESLGVQAVAAGAQDFLVKAGFDAAQLRRSIRFATQRKRAERRELDAGRQAAFEAAVAARDELAALKSELSQLAQQLLANERETTRRVAQALHDQLGQTLAVARLEVDACRAGGGDAAAALAEPLRRVGGLLDRAVREVRHVLADLRPPLLEDQGLAAALDNEVRGHLAAHGGADVLLEADDAAAAARWPDDVQYAAFMVAREAVANALQHAGATLVRVVLEGDATRLALAVVDDGRGVPPALMRGRPGHLGIVGMRERCLAIGAAFSIADEPGGGARVALHWEAPR